MSGQAGEQNVYSGYGPSPTYPQHQYGPSSAGGMPPGPMLQYGYQPPPPPQPQFPSWSAAPPPQSQSCYNCGAPNHWAQDCPEPKRAVPVGAMRQPNGRRPPKRQKQNHSPVGPAFPGPNQTPPISYGPPTPITAQSPYGTGPRTNSWPMQSPQQPIPPPHVHAQPHQQHQYLPPHSPPSASRASIGSSDSMGFYRPQFQSPPAAHAPPRQQQQQNFRNSRGRGRADYGKRSASFHGHGPNGQHHQHSPQQMSPPAFSPDRQPFHWNQQEHPPHLPPQKAARNTSRQAQLSPQVDPELEETPTTPESQQPSSSQTSPNDELQSGLLSWETIAETPQSSTSIGTSIWHPAERIGKPVPPFSLGSDEPYSLVPFNEEEHDCISQYFSATEENELEVCKSIRSTPYWSQLQDDPIFMTIPDTCKMIPLSELRVKRPCREASEASFGTRSSSDENEDEGDDHRSSSQSIRGRTHSRSRSSFRSRSDSQGSASGSAGPGRQVRYRRGSNTSTMSREDDSYSRSNSLKRKRSVESKISPSPDRRGSQYGHSSPRKYQANQHEPRRNGQAYRNRGGRYQSNGAWQRREEDDYNPNASWDAQRPPKGQNRRYQESERPPMPNSHERRRSASPPYIPDRRNSETHQSSRQTQPAEEPKKEPRRQADDVTPRFRKRQPVVAEAYSRRW